MVNNYVFREALQKVGLYDRMQKIAPRELFNITPPLHHLQIFWNRCNEYPPSEVDARVLEDGITAAYLGLSHDVRGHEQKSREYLAFRNGGFFEAKTGLWDQPTKIEVVNIELPDDIQSTGKGTKVIKPTPEQTLEIITTVLRQAMSAQSHE